MTENPLPLQPAFVSMIKIDGIPIPVPPLITAEDRKNIEEWRKQAIAIEEKIAVRRNQLGSSGLHKVRLQSSKIGAIPARSANFEERPQSRSVSGEQVLVRRALTSAAYNDEKAHALAGMLHKVTLDEQNGNSDAHSSPSHQKSVDENGQVQLSTASGGVIPSASSTDLEPYLSQSSTSTSESVGTVRPETTSADISDDQRHQQASATARGSYTIETPSSALLQYKQAGSALSKEAVANSNKPQFGHLGSMVARYLTEQQRAKNLSEYEKLQSILQENSPVTSASAQQSSNIVSSPETSPSKRAQLPANVTSSPSVAGVKRRMGGDTKASRVSASDRLVAVVRGTLVRRVMQTAKVQHWIQTIGDCRRLLTPEPSPGLDWRSLTDSRFREQLTSQLATALQEFHAIMFEWPLAERLALISKDNMPRGTTPHSTSSRPGIKPRVSPAAIAASSRVRSLSASSLQSHHQIQHKQQNAVISTLRNASAVDVTKRRRIGAVTPPRVPPAPSHQPPRVVNRPHPPTRPTTASGSNGTRSPGVASRINSGVVSPRAGLHAPVNSHRPNTAAPSIPSVPDTRGGMKRNDVTVVISQPHQQSSSTTTRRSTISGPHGNARR